MTRGTITTPAAVARPRGRPAGAVPKGRRRPTMAEAKSRRDAAPPPARPRARGKPDLPDGEADDRAATLTEPAPPDRDGPAAGDPRREPPAAPPRPRDDEPRGFDEEVNSRYEEIKRGS